MGSATADNIVLLSNEMIMVFTRLRLAELDSSSIKKKVVRRAEIQFAYDDKNVVAKED